MGLGILAMLFLFAFGLMRQVSRRTKVVVAKSSISQYAVLLETVKADANYYPPATNNTLESLTYKTTPTGYGNGWRGPYINKTPVDP